MSAGGQRRDGDSAQRASPDKATRGEGLSRLRSTREGTDSDAPRLALGTAELAENDELTAARERIAELEAEVARLSGRITDQQSIDLLRSQLIRAAALPKLRASYQASRPLDQVVATAMQSLRARAGSLYLVDGQELVFESALGSHAADLAGRRIPADRGIAGWVAATGQAIAVADVQQDPRWARDIAQDIGYAPIIWRWRHCSRMEALSACYSSLTATTAGPSTTPTSSCWGSSRNRRQCRWSSGAS